MPFSATRLRGLTMRLSTDGSRSDSCGCTGPAVRRRTSAATSCADTTLRSVSTSAAQGPTTGKLPSAAYGQVGAVQRNPAGPRATPARHRGHTSSGSTDPSVASTTSIGPPSVACGGRVTLSLGGAHVTGTLPHRSGPR
jgi:hypothetical protein